MSHHRTTSAITSSQFALPFRPDMVIMLAKQAAHAIGNYHFCVGSTGNGASTEIYSILPSYPCTVAYQNPSRSALQTKCDGSAHFSSIKPPPPAPPLACPFFRGRNEANKSLPIHSDATAVPYRKTPPAPCHGDAR